MIKYLSFSLFLVALSAQASVLLTVDISNLSAVTFTATGNPALVNDTGTITSDGITLLGFCTADIGDQHATATGNLTASGDAMAYNMVFTDYLSTYGDAHVDLNLIYAGTSGVYETQDFNTESSALTGQLVLALAEGFPVQSVGSIGYIYSGFSGNVGALIGSYQVVPEPATTGLLLGAAGLAVVALRRRRS